jgi:hypothetical protein
LAKSEEKNTGEEEEEDLFVFNDTIEGSRGAKGAAVNDDVLEDA